MTEAELLAQIADLQVIATYLALLLIAVGVMLAVLPVGRCDHCPHCRAEAANGIQMCPICRLAHRPGEGKHDV